MGQTYCVGLCGERTEAQQSIMALPSNQESDEPVQKFAKRVKQHIELHPKVKETYMLYRTPHSAEKKGIRLELYYLFEFAAYYEGQWKNGLPHGYGRIIYDDGSLYEGCFKNGIAECHQALFIKVDGSFYRGAIKQNKASGYGELSTSKLFYKGPWVNDLPHGKARQIYSSISFYQGEFLQGVKQGDGIYQWNPQEYYIGKFSKNKLDGYGELLTKEYTYKGNFKEGKKHGKGSYIDETSRYVFTGNFENNEPRGQGELKYQDGTVVKGLFRGNYLNYKGKMQLTDGDIVDIDTQQDELQNDLSIDHEIVKKTLKN